MFLLLRIEVGFVSTVEGSRMDARMIGRANMDAVGILMYDFDSF